MSFEAPVPAPWLSIVGLGMQGIAELTPAARSAIEQAGLVAGSQRQLSMVQSLLVRQTLAWPSPLAEGLSRVLARRGLSTCILASGDPFFFGIGATLAPRLRPGEFVCYPAPSSVSIAAARLAWPLQDTDVVSLHGRDLHGVIRYLQPQRRLLVLSWDQRTPAQLAQLLCERGFGRSQLQVLEALGGTDERLRSCQAQDFQFHDIADLNIVGIEVVAPAGSFSIPYRASLPDSAFEHDGQLTKQEVRALTLSALAPHPGERLWDVGAGAGSIAIEWMLSHPACRAVALEPDPERCARILRNAAELGVPSLELVQSSAPAGLAGLAPPDAVFIGGGATAPGVFEHCWRALPPGGRLVINAVSLQTEGLLLGWYGRYGGELCRVSIERAAPLGSLTGWRPAMPVTQWKVVKK
jgi:precorrin-6Y C5,15-methyltransferase (decarboxylating)